MHCCGTAQSRDAKQTEWHRKRDLQHEGIVVLVAVVVASGVELTVAARSEGQAVRSTWLVASLKYYVVGRMS